MARIHCTIVETSATANGLEIGPKIGRLRRRKAIGRTGRTDSSLGWSRSTAICFPGQILTSRRWSATCKWQPAPCCPTVGRGEPHRTRTQSRRRATATGGLGPTVIEAATEMTKRPPDRAGGSPSLPRLRRGCQAAVDTRIGAAGVPAAARAVRRASAVRAAALGSGATRLPEFAARQPACRNGCEAARSWP